MWIVNFSLHAATLSESFSMLVITLSVLWRTPRRGLWIQNKGQTDSSVHNINLKPQKTKFHKASEHVLHLFSKVTFKRMAWHLTDAPSQSYLAFSTVCAYTWELRSAIIKTENSLILSVTLLSGKIIMCTWYYGLKPGMHCCWMFFSHMI